VDDTKKRILGYGSSMLIAGALGYVAFVRQVRADVDTLVGAAEVQVRLAASMPADGRADLVRQTHEFLDNVEAQQADNLPARELRAQLFYLEERYGDAAAMYGWLQDSESATPQQRDLFALNRSRMLRAAGDASAAERVLNEHGPRFLEESAADSQIEKARVLAQLGRESEALEIIGRLAASAQAPMVLLTAGTFLEHHGMLAMADTAYQKAAGKDPLADYYRARLKLRESAYDTDLDLLERVMRAAGPRVRVLLQQDREAWAPCARSKRYKDLLGPVSKPARPGR